MAWSVGDVAVEDEAATCVLPANWRIDSRANRSHALLYVVFLNNPVDLGPGSIGGRLPELAPSHFVAREAPAEPPDEETLCHQKRILGIELVLLTWKGSDAATAA